jgi:hypothetical protein
MNILRFFSAALAATFFATAAHAQPNQPFDPATYGGSGANVISISGIIPEFIEFTVVDDALEMGNIGGPEATGEQISTSSVASPYAATTIPINALNPHSGSGFVALGSGENGAAGVELRSNTFIRVETSGTRLRNNGIDNIRGNADDVILPTQYARAVYGGNVRRSNVLVPNNAIKFRSDINLWGGPIVNEPRAYSSLLFGPTTRSGFVWIARVTRNGLNNLSGNYSATLTSTYYKY